MRAMTEGQSPWAAGGAGVECGRRNKWLLMSLNTQLLQAVIKSEKEQVQRLLERGACPLSRCRSSMMTTCHLAALRGDGDILALLLERLEVGCEGPTARDEAGRQPHHMAAFSGQLNALTVLLERAPHLTDSRVEVQDLSDQVTEEHLDSFLHQHEDIDNMVPHFTDGSTALHIAAQFGYLSIVEYLLEDMQADLTMKDSLERTAMDVIGTIHTKSVDLQHGLLLRKDNRDSGSDETDALSGDRKTVSLAAHEANAPEPITRSKDLLAYLKHRGGEPTSHPNARTLHNIVRAAYESGSTEHLQESLLWYKDNNFSWLLQVPDERGRLPIHTAVELTYKSGMEVLLMYCPSSVNKLDNEGDSPLHIAVRKDWPEGVGILLGYTDMNNHPRNESETVLHTAASLKSRLILRMLLASDCQSMINMKDINGYTPLLRMVEVSDIPPRDIRIYGNSTEEHITLWCFNTLYENTQLRETTKDGDSLIHLAARLSRINLLKALHLQGTEWPKWFNRRGYNPLHLAAMNTDSPLCLQYLLDCCSSEDTAVRTESSSAATILHIAARTGNLKAMELIIESRMGPALVAMEDLKRRQPLILACSGRFRDCVELLIKNGADLAADSRLSDIEKYSALDLVAFKIPDSVKMMSDLLDSYIERVDEKENEQNSYFEILLNFKCFLAKKSKQLSKRVNFTYGAATKEVQIEDGELLQAESGSERGRQMRVISSIVNCKHEAMRNMMLLHPLTESFIMLKWKKLRFIHYIVCFLSMLHIVALLGIGMLSYENMTFIVINLVLPIISLGLELIILKSLTKVKLYLSDLENWLKCSVIWTSIAISCAGLMRIHWHWLRCLNSLAILLAFIQTLFLFGKFPGRGLWVFIHFKVASRVLKVLMTFLLLILGFAFALLILFNGEHPFENLWSTMTKIVIMMVELDYNGVYTAAEVEMNTPIGILGRILYICFAITVVMSVTNLMFGMSVSNVNQLVKEGRALFLAKMATFIVLLERVAETVGLLKWFTIRETKWKVWPNMPAMVVRTVGPDGKMIFGDNSLRWSVKRGLLKRLLKNTREEDTDSLAE